MSPRVALAAIAALLCVGLAFAESQSTLVDAPKWPARVRPAFFSRKPVEALLGNNVLLENVIWVLRPVPDLSYSFFFFYWSSTLFEASFVFLTSTLA
jgi:hypothetical protein